MRSRLPARSRAFAAAIAATLSLAAWGCSTSTSSLKGAYGDRFRVGVALGGTLPDDYSDTELALVDKHFEVVTPTNSMKMAILHPEPGRYEFETADALVAFAEARGLKVAGHCLMWANDGNTPGWIFRDGDGTVGREELLRRLREHIHTVAGRYRGRVYSWDVINESLGDSGVELRESTWLSVIGPEYIDLAFGYAHEADPDALLIYNDYNIVFPEKRAKLLRLLRGLVDRGVPIDAVGMQGHWELDDVPFDEIEATIDAIHELGLKVLVTELDIDVVKRSRWWADGGAYRDELAEYDPYPNGCPPEILARQAEQYARLFEIFARRADAVERITFWDLHDGRSWLNTFPWQRTNHPLLFDRDARPKPALDAVLGAQGR